MRASIIIPAFNTAQRLRLLLESLTVQTWPLRDFEVIVVDDGSTDDTTSMVQTYQQRLQLRVLRRRNGGRSAARNTGIHEAQGEIILLSDADMLASPNWVAHHIKAQERSHRTAFLGAVGEIITIHPGWIPYFLCLKVLDNARCGGRISRILFNALMKMPGQRLRVSDQHFVDDLQRLAATAPPTRTTRIGTEYGPELQGLAIPWVLFLTGNVSLRRDDMLRVGGFREDFSGWGLEDVEMGYRLFESGVRIQFCAEAWNYHQAHRRNWQAQDAQLRRNFDRFYEIHPTEPVRLHWDYLCGRLSLEDYNKKVGEHAHI